MKTALARLGIGPGIRLEFGRLRRIGGDAAARSSRDLDGKSSGSLLCRGPGHLVGLRSASSAAIAFGSVESEFEPKDHPAPRGRYHQANPDCRWRHRARGQTLILLEDTRANAEVQSLRGQLWMCIAREARLTAEQHGLERVSFLRNWRRRARRINLAASVLLGRGEASLKHAGRCFNPRSPSIGKKYPGLKRRSRASRRRQARPQGASRSSAMRWRPSPCWSKKASNCRPSSSEPRTGGGRHRRTARRVNAQISRADRSSANRIPVS